MFGMITHTPISSYYNPAANVYRHTNSWQNRGQSSTLLLSVSVSLEDRTGQLSWPVPVPVPVPVCRKYSALDQKSRRPDFSNGNSGVSICIQSRVRSDLPACVQGLWIGCVIAQTQQSEE